MTDPSPSLRRPQHRIFEFSEARLDGRRLLLNYALRGGPDPDIGFLEELRLPEELPAPDPADPVVRRLVEACHRVLGVSYFKAAIPPVIEAAPVGAEDAAFWDTLYSIGMGEFYFRNRLDPRDRVAFPRLTGNPPPAGTAAAPRGSGRALVLLGGGKDSAVAADIVRHAGVEADALSLGTSRWISASAASAGLRLLTIRRKLDPALLELNRRGAWNGHVPISACIAFLAVLAGYTGAYTDIIVGNERSAEEGNVAWNGMTINHQWSKTLVFEQDFQAWCRRNTPTAPRYFSLLRPLGEIAIAAAFARQPANYGNFTSCNANFRQAGATVPDRWCGRCPKCLSVELMLSPHVDDAGLARIFPKSFLAESENTALLEHLLGIRGTKPWECVSTTMECRLSLTLLHRQGRLRGGAADWLRTHPEILVPDAEAALRESLQLAGPHSLPSEWEERLRAYLGSGQ